VAELAQLAARLVAVGVRAAGVECDLGVAQLADRRGPVTAGGQRAAEQDLGAPALELQARVPRERAGLARGPGCRLGVPAGK